MSNDFEKFMEATDQGYMPRLSINDMKPHNIVYLGARFEMVNFGSGEEASMIYTIYDNDDKKLKQLTSGSRSVANAFATADQGTKATVQMTKQGMKSKVNVTLVGTVDAETLNGLLDKMTEEFPEEAGKLAAVIDPNNPPF